MAGMSQEPKNQKMFNKLKQCPKKHLHGLLYFLFCLCAMSYCLYSTVCSSGAWPTFAGCRPQSISLLPAMLPLQLDWLTSLTRLVSSTGGQQQQPPLQGGPEGELDSGNTGAVVAHRNTHWADNSGQRGRGRGVPRGNRRGSGSSKEKE